jgi:hypothetical protein
MLTVSRSGKYPQSPVVPAEQSSEWDARRLGNAPSKVIRQVLREIAMKGA